MYVYDTPRMSTGVGDIPVRIGQPASLESSPDRSRPAPPPKLTDFYHVPSMSTCE